MRTWQQKDTGDGRPFGRDPRAPRQAELAESDQLAGVFASMILAVEKEVSA